MPINRPWLNANLRESERRSKSRTGSPVSQLEKTLQDIKYRKKMTSPLTSNNRHEQLPLSLSRDTYCGSYRNNEKKEQSLKGSYRVSSGPDPLSNRSHDQNYRLSGPETADKNREEAYPSLAGKIQEEMHTTHVNQYSYAAPTTGVTNQRSDRSSGDQTCGGNSSDDFLGMRMLERADEEISEKRDKKNYTTHLNLTNSLSARSELSAKEREAYDSMPGRLRSESISTLRTDGTSLGSVSSLTDWSDEEDWEALAGVRYLDRLSPCKRQTVLLLVLRFLDVQSLLNASLVCKEWLLLARQPVLWTRVHLCNRRISPAFLQSISRWCSRLQVLSLSRLGAPHRKVQTKEDYKKNIRGWLESGLEHLLFTSGAKLAAIKIVDCPYILTDRTLFLISCHCRHLASLTFISSSHTIGHEVLWALSAGCPNLKSLRIYPKYPRKSHHKKLNNKCLEMIGQCWPQLQALGVGGRNINDAGLAVIAKRCSRLQVLELVYAPSVTEETAKVLCGPGMRGLHTLILRHTHITPAAVQHFYSSCAQLKSIQVHIVFEDFFEAAKKTEQNLKQFDSVIASLKALKKRHGLRDILHISTVSHTA